MALVKLCAWTVLALLARGLSAQFYPDEWLINGTWLNSPADAHWLDAGAVATRHVFGGRYAALAGDGRGGGFSAAISGVVHLDYDATTNQVTIGPVGFSQPIQAIAVAVDRQRVWLLGRSGNLGFLYRGGSATQSPGSVGNVLQWANKALGTHEVCGACTDGRSMFYMVKELQGAGPEIWEWDQQKWLAGNGVVVRRIAQLLGSGSTALPKQGSSVQMGPDGKVMFVDGYLMSCDPVTGAMLQYGSNTWGATSPSPQPGVHQNPVFAYNVWDGSAVAIGWHPASNRHVFRFDGSNWGLSHTAVGLGIEEFNNNIGGVMSTSSVPFLVYGTGCADGSGVESKIGWRGLPRRGSSFDVTVRQAQAGAWAVFWLGVSDTVWPGLGALPYSLASMGAPNCDLLAAWDMSFLLGLNGSGEGRVTIAVPANAALAGFEVFAQVASVSNGNLLGVVVSDGLWVHIR